MTADKQLKRVGILNYYQFPEGMASTTRIIAYSKGLVENGVDVESIIFRPKLQSDTTPDDGMVSGLTYHYCYRRPDNCSKLTKFFRERPKSLFATVKYIKQQHEVNPYDYILLSFDSLPLLFYFVYALKNTGIILAFIGDEFPIAIREKFKKTIPSWEKKLYCIVSRGLKVRILMTNVLKEFYNNEISWKPTYILPTIIDTDRFSKVKHCPNLLDEEEFLCYLGGMQLNNDNVDNIIIAYSKLSDINIPLYLYGNPTKEDKAILEKLIHDLSLDGKVFIKGRVNYSEVPQILASAKLLLTSQSNTLRAKGGFPTKLGEYLLSGSPSIVTDVGEISDVVKDGETCYIVKPENPDLYAQKMQYVLSHYDEALLVAERGRQFVLETFQAKKVAKGLKTFLEKNLK